MIAELEPNPTFMILLTCIGERLAEISAEKDLYECFRVFDDDNDGFVEGDLLKFWMTEKGDKINEKDYEYLIRGCEENGKIDYKKLVSKIKHGEIIETNIN